MWLTKIESLIEDLRVYLERRGYETILKRTDPGIMIIRISKDNVETAIIRIIKKHKSMNVLKPLDKYLEPYVLQVDVYADNEYTCNAIKLILMKGGG